MAIVRRRSQGHDRKTGNRWFPKDAGLWAFVAAMVLYHAANAPGGVYLGLFLKRDLHAPERMLAYAFAVSMVAWMLVVWPAGWLADRWGRKPLLIAGWTIMAVRLGLVAVVQTPWLAVANQALDGLGNGLFAVLAAAWVTDRLADPRRSGEAQVIVGSCLVLGSAIGPAAAAVPGRAARLPGPVRRPGGRRRRRDGDRRVLRPRDLGAARRTHRRPDVIDADGHDVRPLDDPVTGVAISDTTSLINDDFPRNPRP